jgi:hypothetical protein
MKSTIQRPKQPKAPPATLRTPKSGGAAPLLPHERDEFVGDVARVPDAQMAQAKKDIDAGMVDTDMRATPGLDAARRAALVPGPGGKPLRAPNKQ